MHKTTEKLTLSKDVVAESLAALGLDGKETATYLACLSLGPCSVTKMAAEAGLKRPTAYLALDGLLVKGMVFASPLGKRTLYSAASPEELGRKARERSEKVEEAVPFLRALAAAAPSPGRFRTVEGRDGIMSVYEEMFRETELWAAVSAARFVAAFPNDENRRLFGLLARNGGFLHDRMEESPEARALASEKYRTGLSETRFFAPGSGFAGTDLLVSEGKAALVSLEGMRAVVVEDRAIAGALGALVRSISSCE